VITMTNFGFRQIIGRTLPLGKPVSGDDICDVMYDPETKRQSFEWKSSVSPRLKKERISKLKVKVMLVCFLHVKEIMYYERVSSKQTMNREFYLQLWDIYASIFIEKDQTFHRTSEFGVSIMLLPTQHYL